MSYFYFLTKKNFKIFILNLNEILHAFLIYFLKFILTIFYKLLT